MFSFLAQMMEEVPTITEMPAEVSPYLMDIEPEVGITGLAIGGLLFFIYLIISLAVFLFIAYCLFRIAKRVNAENPWFAWIPILQTVLMIQIAKKPVWWIVLLLLPFVNIVIMILILVDFLKALGKPGWWTILFLIPGVNLVIWIVLAFEKPQEKLEIPQDSNISQPPTQ